VEIKTPRQAKTVLIKERGSREKIPSEEGGRKSTNI